jgi:hypothetical protein
MNARWNRDLSLISWSLQEHRKYLELTVKQFVMNPEEKFLMNLHFPVFKPVQLTVRTIGSGKQLISIQGRLGVGDRDDEAPENYTRSLKTSFLSRIEDEVRDSIDLFFVRDKH